jgi:hypothetical protein
MQSNIHSKVATRQKLSQCSVRIWALIVILLLAGCSAAPVESPTDSPSTPTTTAPAEDDMAACALVSDLLTPVQDIVTGIVDDPTGGTLDAANVSNVAEDLRSLLQVTTPKMDAYAAPFASVVLILDDMFEGRTSGNQSLDTGAYRDAAIDIIFYCVDEVGYSANG